MLSAVWWRWVYNLILLWWSWRGNLRRLGPHWPRVLTTMGANASCWRSFVCCVSSSYAWVWTWNRDCFVKCFRWWSTSLLLGIPILHALNLQATQPEHSNTDIWADSLLNKSAHAAKTHKSTCTKFVQELTKIANEFGIPTTCNEYRLPYREEGLNQQSRTRAHLRILTRFKFNIPTKLPTQLQF